MNSAQQMISGNFLENIFKVKTSFFIIFIILVTSITSFEISKNFDWVRPLDLNSEFNKNNNQILSLVLLFAVLKVIVRFWDFLVSISNYGKLHKEISRDNIGAILIQIGIRKSIIEFINFKYQGKVTLHTINNLQHYNKITIEISAGNSIKHQEYTIQDNNFIELFKKHANIDMQNNEFTIVYNRTNGSNDISPDFLNKMNEFKNSLENEIKLLSLLFDSNITGPFFLKMLWLKFWRKEY